MALDRVKNPANDNLTPGEQHQKRKDGLLEFSSFVNTVQDWAKKKRKMLAKDPNPIIEVGNANEIKKLKEAGLDTLETALEEASGHISKVKESDLDPNTYKKAQDAISALIQDYNRVAGYFGE